MPATTAHPLGQLASFELRNLRAELESALADVAPDTSAAADLRRQLADVAAEEDDRRRIASAR
jgi:hypothetical protein